MSPQHRVGRRQHRHRPGSCAQTGSIIGPTDHRRRHRRHDPDPPQLPRLRRGVGGLQLPHRRHLRASPTADDVNGTDPCSPSSRTTRKGSCCCPRRGARCSAGIPSELCVPDLSGPVPARPAVGAVRRLAGGAQRATRVGTSDGTTASPATSVPWSTRRQTRRRPHAAGVRAVRERADSSYSAPAGRWRDRVCCHSPCRVAIGGQRAAASAGVGTSSSTARSAR